MDLVTFTEEILDGKLHFLCCACCLIKRYKSSLIIFFEHKIFGKLKQELRVTISDVRFTSSNELHVLIHELRVQIYELRVQVYELRVKIHELRVPIHELRVQI